MIIAATLASHKTAMSTFEVFVFQGSGISLSKPKLAKQDRRGRKHVRSSSQKVCPGRSEDMKQYKHHGGSLRRDHGGCKSFGR